MTGDVVPVRPDAIDVAVMHPEDRIIRSPWHLAQAHVVAGEDVDIAVQPEVERLVEARYRAAREVMGFRQCRRSAHIARRTAGGEDRLPGVGRRVTIRPKQRTPYRVVLHAE